MFPEGVDIAELFEPSTAKSEDQLAGAAGKPISPSNILRRFVVPACDTLKLPKATWLRFRRPI